MIAPMPDRSATDRRVGRWVRALRFICWYLPELLRIWWENRRRNVQPVLPEPGSDRLERVNAFYGPLYVLRHDPGLRAVRKFGYYDLTLTVALVRHLRRGMAVINVGANVGYFAALAAVRTQAVVLCVDADPRCVEALRKNQELYPQLRVCPCLASDRAGNEPFILDATSTGNSSIARSASGPTVFVPAETLDALVGSGPADVLVIDAQGSEPKVFAGARSVLERLSLIFFEFWPYGLERAGFRPEDCLSLLRSQGFRIRHFFPSFHPDPESEPERLIASLRGEDRGMGFCNLLAARDKAG
jgi:FkbM family methyltransferase